MISLKRVLRWKLDPTHHHRLAIRRDPDVRDITGNEIKKIANNSNPNCHGHIPRQTAIRSREGGHGGKRKRELKRQRGERERARARETTLQLLISMHHLSILASASLIDFHSAGCMAARYPGAIFNHLAFVESYLWGARKIAAGRNTRGDSYSQNY